MYTYIFKDGSELVKCKGLRPEAIKTLSPEKMREMLVDPTQTFLGVNPGFRKDRNVISTVWEEKQLKDCYVKRLVPFLLLLFFSSFVLSIIFFFQAFRRLQVQRDRVCGQIRKAPSHSGAG